MMTDEEKTVIVKTLDGIILAVAPKASKVPKYGGVLYTLKPKEKEGQFCGIFVYKSHVQLSFSLGSQLSDPLKTLQGKGKHRRHVSFESAEEVNAKVLISLLKQAAKR